MVGFKDNGVKALVVEMGERITYNPLELLIGTHVPHPYPYGGSATNERWIKYMVRPAEVSMLEVAYLLNLNVGYFRSNECWQLRVT